MLQWTYTLMFKRFIKIHPSAAETHSISSHCSCDRRMEAETNNKRPMMIYLIHLGLLYATMSQRNRSSKRYIFQVYPNALNSNLVGCLYCIQGKQREHKKDKSVKLLHVS